MSGSKRDEFREIGSGTTKGLLACCHGQCAALLPDHNPYQWLCNFSCNHTLISDWYGTSREFAAALIESRRCWGSRREMVLVVGFRLGSTTRWAFVQSR